MLIIIFYIFFLISRLMCLSESLLYHSSSEDEKKLPFCEKCSCELKNHTFTIISCNNNNMTTDQLFNISNWYNNETGKFYLMQQLSIQNSVILSLNRQFPPANLTLLDLSNNGIVNISDNIFKNLQQLEILILSYNNIELLHPNVFQGLYLENDFMPLRSLKILKLDHNKIHSLDGDIFEHTNGITELHLNSNPMKQIDEQTLIAITSLTYLKKLDLSNTEISNLPAHFMHTPKYIEWLDLSSNNFTEIPTTLSESHNLQVLFFDNNPIVNLTQDNGFLYVPTLQILHMCYMEKLCRIEKNSLSALANLQELHICNNINLAYLDKEALSEKRNGAEYETWPPLKKIYIENNKLTHLDMHFYANWNDLSQLDLTNNPWACECENQWMVDELIPIYLRIDKFKAKSLRCAAPIEMNEFSFYDIYEKHSNMRCLDLYGNRPEKDAALLVGILAGLLISIPFVLLLIYTYQRNWFGLFDKSPAAYTRQFYQRTSNTDDYY